MSSKPLVSAIVAFLDAKSFIEEAIERTTGKLRNEPLRTFERTTGKLRNEPFRSFESRTKGRLKNLVVGWQAPRRRTRTLCASFRAYGPRGAGGCLTSSAASRRGCWAENNNGNDDDAGRG
jgi:uncharacterized protein YlaI